MNIRPLHFLPVVVLVAFTAVLLSPQKADVPAPAAVPSEPPTCPAPITNLEGLRSELMTLANRHHIILNEGGQKQNEATDALRHTVVRARDCWNLTLQDMEISEEFWLTIARPLNEIPRIYVSR